MSFQIATEVSCGHRKQIRSINVKFDDRFPVREGHYYLYLIGYVAFFVVVAVVSSSSRPPFLIFKKLTLHHYIFDTNRKSITFFIFLKFIFQKNPKKNKILFT